MRYHPRYIAVINSTINLFMKKYYNEDYQFINVGSLYSIISSNIQKVCGYIKYHIIDKKTKTDFIYTLELFCNIVLTEYNITIEIENKYKPILENMINNIINTSINNKNCSICGKYNKKYFEKNYIFDEKYDDINIINICSMCEDTYNDIEHFAIINIPMKPAKNLPWLVRNEICRIIKNSNDNLLTNLLLNIVESDRMQNIKENAKLYGLYIGLIGNYESIKIFLSLINDYDNKIELIEYRHKLSEVGNVHLKTIKNLLDKLNDKDDNFYKFSLIFIPSELTILNWILEMIHNKLSM